MATPIGTNVVTSIARHYILPQIVDNIYGSNPYFFRMNKANKRVVQGGTQIEVPFMYSRFTNGGWYQGFDQLNVAPNDTIKNGALDWKQAYVPFSVDGLTLIKTDSPQAIANIIKVGFQQMQMEMAEILGTALMSDGSVSNSKQIDGLKATIDAGSVATTYAGLTRSSNTYLNSQVDSTTSTLTLPALRSHFMNVGSGGRHPTIMASRTEQWVRYANILTAFQQFPVGVGGSDEIMASAGFTNLLFMNVPWIEDSHVFDGPNTSNSAILTMNEDYFWFCVSPRADFYMQDFQQPVDQDAMTSMILWAGNLVCGNTQRQGKMTNISA